jgi:hypothetical protein
MSHVSPPFGAISSPDGTSRGPVMVRASVSPPGRDDGACREPTTMSPAPRSCGSSPLHKAMDHVEHVLMVGISVPFGSSGEYGAKFGNKPHIRRSQHICQRSANRRHRLPRFEPWTCHHTKHQLRGATMPLACSRPMQPDATTGGQMPVAMGYAWDESRLKAGARWVMTSPAGRHRCACWLLCRRRRRTWHRRGAGLRRCGRRVRQPESRAPRR